MELHLVRQYFILSSLCLFSVLAVRAEEDPSYEPFKSSRPSAPPKRAISLADDSTPTPKPPPVGATRVIQAPSYVPDSYNSRNAYSQPNAVAPAPVYAPTPTVTQPTGPKVKYILNGKPIYEGDPDPVAEANAKALLSKNQPAPVESRPYATVPPARVRTEIYTPPSTQAVSAPSGPKVKYILNGKPVYEGDPDPVAAQSTTGPTNDYSAAAVMARLHGTPPTTAPASSAALLDDVTADKPNAVGGKRTGAGSGPLVLEEFTAPEALNSKGKKGYEAIADLKTHVEAISRFMDNRGKENARLVHTSETVLANINSLAEIWPKNPAFIDICTTTKRSALLYNEELRQVPWTWTRVRWSYDSLVADVRSLRAQAKLLADAEPKPQMMVTKEGKVVYIDAPDMSVDPITAQREAANKYAREKIQNIRKTDESREDRKKTKMDTSLDN